MKNSKSTAKTHRRKESAKKTGLVWVGFSLRHLGALAPLPPFFRFIYQR
jgi:hypothetical protein